MNRKRCSDYPSLVWIGFNKMRRIDLCRNPSISLLLFYILSHSKENLVLLDVSVLAHHACLLLADHVCFVSEGCGKAMMSKNASYCGFVEWKLTTIMLGCNGWLPGYCCVVAREFWVVTYCHPNHKPLWWFGPYIWLHVSLWDFFCKPGSDWLNHIWVIVS